MSSIRELEARLRKGERIDYVFFWRAHATMSEAGPWVLSQWWPRHPFVVDGQIYATAEHFMMAEKASLMGDVRMRDRILCASSPAEAKALGCQVEPWDQERWLSSRVDVVVRGNRAKFTQHADLERYLLSTDDQVLVEASPKDRIWGIGLAEEREEVRDPGRWRGQNLLGFAIMQVRQELRSRSRGAAPRA